MLWSVHAAKGGVGTTVVAASIAVRLSRRQPVLLADFGGDLDQLLGVETGPVGLRDWLAAESSVPAADVTKLSVEVTDSLELMPAGGTMCLSAVAPQRTMQLVDALTGVDRLVVVDLGVVEESTFAPRSVVRAASDRSTMVVRACYLGLKRAQRLGIEADHIVEMVEGGRSLGTLDIESVLGRPVTERVAVDPAIARAVDAGLFTSRLPRSLRRLADSLEPVTAVTS